MRPVYALGGGVSNFAKARPDRPFQPIVKDTNDDVVVDLGFDLPKFASAVDGPMVASYHSEHIRSPSMSGIMALAHPWLRPKPSRCLRAFRCAMAGRRRSLQKPPAHWP
jgi:hypothetical protein